MKATSLLVALACLSLPACAAGGTQVKESQLSQFRKDVTTDQEVISALGQPNTNTLQFDGSRMMCYTYSQMAVRPQTFIPIVGGFIGGADMKMNTACLQFTPKGVLKDFTTTSSQIGSGGGLASGVGNNGRVANEPKQAR